MTRKYGNQSFFPWMDIITSKRFYWFFERCCSFFPDAILIFLIGLVVVPAYAFENMPLDRAEVLGLGTWRIVGDDIAGAKRKAIEEAQTNGVENYILGMVSPDILSGDFPRFIVDIIPKAKKRISSFHIVAETQVNGNYSVAVLLKLNRDLIRQDLESAGLLHDNMPRIKVLFMVYENRGGTVSYWWKDPGAYFPLTLTEIALNKVFQESNFIPIDRTASVPDIKDPGLFSLELRNQDLAVWGKAFSADLVVAGHTVIDKRHVQISLKAVELSHGALLYQDRQSENIDGLSDDEIAHVVEGMIRRTVSNMTPVILRSIGSEGDTVTSVEIELNGVDSLSKVLAFKKFLEERVPSVGAVREVRLKRRSVTFDVEYAGKRDLSDEILTNSFLPFTVDYIGTLGKRGIVLRVRPPGEGMLQSSALFQSTNQIWLLCER